MTLHQIRIFVAVSKHLNVTRASQELHVTQPSVSRQLRLLAEECGVGLYRVTSRGVELTEEGRLLLSNVQPILFQVERIGEIFRRRKKSTVLSIGGSHSPSLSLLPLLSAAFKKSHPEAQIVIRTDGSRAVEQFLLNSEVEMAVITNPSRFLSLIYEPCRRERLVVCASAKHPLAKKQRMTREELARAPLVIGRRGAAEFAHAEEILRRLEELGDRPDIVMQCDSSQAMRAALKAGVGLGIVDRDLVEPDLRRRELKIIRVATLEMEADSFVVYPRERALSPMAREFLDLLRQWTQRTQWTVTRPPGPALVRSVRL